MKKMVAQFEKAHVIPQCLEAKGWDSHRDQTTRNKYNRQ